MTTFSQLVDLVVSQTRRTDMRLEIVDYLDQTIREAHFHPENNASVMYDENLVEELLVANKDSGFGWSIPDSAAFQAMQTVHYQTCDVWPDPVTPSRGLQGRTDYYYRAGNRFSFAGYGGTNALVAIAYYQYPRQLKYYPVGQRPAEYDSDMGWTYAPEFDTSDDLRESAQRFTTNWLLMRWHTVLKEGLRAKIYKRLSDTERARTSYSLYQSLRMGLVTGESARLGGFG